MSESAIRRGDRVRLTGEHVWANGHRPFATAPKGATGVVMKDYHDGDVAVAWEEGGSSWAVAASSLTRIVKPRVIRPEDVRVGDTIRVECPAFGMTITRTGTVASLDGHGSPRTAEDGCLWGATILGEATTVTLLDRPEPTLPTEPGAVILCAEVRGEPYDGIAVLGSAGAWWTPVPVGGCSFHKPEDIGPGWPRPGRKGSDQ